MEGFSAVFAIFSAYGTNLLLGIVVAPLIYADANKLPVLFLNTKPWFWAACALFLGPLWTALVYWAIHHSSVSNREGANSSGQS